MKKRGQFFILAAVVLSLLMFSMAFSANYVRANDPDKAFFDYADIIEREADSVLDYQVYSDVEDMDSFVDLLEADFQDSEVGANLLFVYGNKTGVKVRNLGTEGVYIGSANNIVKGATATVQSKIRVGGFATVELDNFNRDKTEYYAPNPGEILNITFNDFVYEFPLSDSNQVIFIVQKEGSHETFVEVR